MQISAESNRNGPEKIQMSVPASNLCSRAGISCHSRRDDPILPLLSLRAGPAHTTSQQIRGSGDPIGSSSGIC
jgi:hypothetical protein